VFPEQAEPFQVVVSVYPVLLVLFSAKSFLTQTCDHRTNVRLLYEPRNLDEAQELCQKLKLLLHSLNPDVDVEALLEKQSGEQSVSRSVSASRATHERKDSIASSEEYEWHETPLSPVPESAEQASGSGDGMASLSIKPYESGYLGMVMDNLPFREEHSS
jgi:hypothetical protein